MGVQNLWKTLSKGGAVEVLEGQQSGHHARIVEAVANKVVAVDLSAWLMQAQTQPALREHYDSDYARAVKVVFDRVSTRTDFPTCQKDARQQLVWHANEPANVLLPREHQHLLEAEGPPVLIDSLAVLCCADNPLAALWLPASVCH